MKILGLDVGNSKIKLCYVESDGVLSETSVRWRSLLLPLLPDGRRDFDGGIPNALRGTAERFGFDPRSLDAVVVCSSHAYSYPLLHESVSHLGRIVASTFGATPAFLVTVDGALTPAHDIAQLTPDALSAHVLSNYYGSAFLGSRLIRDGLSIDIGTTSTDVIPIVSGRVDPQGLAKPSDYLRFRHTHHRIAWYGLTWTPLVMIAPEVVTPAGTYQVVARNHRTDLVFALHDEIDQELLREHAYSPPPDRQRALAGLSELVGLDRRILDDNEILAVRDFLHERLIDRVAALATAVVRENFQQPPAQLDVAVFALGEQVLALPAMHRAGFDSARIRRLSFGRAQGLWSASSAFAMALLGLEQMLGRRVDVQ